MAEITANSITKAPLKAGSTVSAIKEATELIKAGQGLANTILGVVNTIRGQGQAQESTVVSSGIGPKIEKIANPKSGNQPQAVDLQAYFSSPEGLKQIVNAIDQLTPMIGDVKLSEVKDLIETAIGPKNEDKPKEEKKKKTKAKDKKK